MIPTPHAKFRIRTLCLKIIKYKIIQPTTVLEVIVQDISTPGIKESC